MSRRFATLFVCAAAWAVTGCGALSERPEGYEKRDYKVDPALRFKSIPLSEIVAKPQVGLAVEFVGLLNRLDENFFQPLYTGFKPEDYRNFSVFTPEAAVWDPQGRSRGSIPTLFIHREVAAISKVVSAEQYAPLKCRAKIIDDAQGRPWIEILDVEAVGNPWFTHDSLSLLINGLGAIKDKPADAVKNLNRALQAPLSPAGRATAYVALAWIAHSLKDYQGAESYYKKAMEIDPGNEDAREGVYRARNRMEPKPLGAAPTMESRPGTTPPGPDTAALTAQLAKANAEIEQLRGQWEKDKADWTRSLTAETEARRAAEAKMADSEGRLKALEMERDDLKKKLETAGGDAAKLAELDGKVKALEMERDETRTKLAAAETERDDLKKKLEGAGGDAAKVAELEGKVKALETERDEAKTKLAAAETERDDLRKKLEAGGTGGDTEALKKQIETKDAEIKTLTEKVAQVEKDAAAAAEAKVKAEYETKLAEQEQKIKDRDDVIKSLREEIDRLNEELKKKGN